MRIYLFFISILFTGYFYGQEPTSISTDSIPVVPNEKEQRENPLDTLPPGEKYGLRIGADISKLIRTYTDDNYEGIEIVGDYRISQKFYIAAEMGNESLIRDEENINVRSMGNYARVGIDYNLYDNWYGMQNMIVVGLRYGFSIFDQTLNDYTIYSTSNYFDTNQITEASRYEDLTASWIGLVIGLKAEILHNVYLSGNISLRSLVSEDTPGNFENLHIPGFGRTNDYSSIGVGYGYSINYFFPLYKKKKQ
ncbi:DUF6048 family protein [Aquimarina pacifica]|uniref:DUF6048 family protein n=1 Tax=Aquimarina pacifica TaxID=1296415 RepID=UPI000470A7CB|nr:DUF6048 family protein [Aquimarina pacifica]